MEYFRFVASLVELLLGCEARYAIGGSFASSIYGEIRSTYDVDLTLQISPEKVAAFIKAVMDRGWYVSPEGVQRAVQNGGDFQVIDGDPHPTPKTLSGTGAFDALWRSFRDGHVAGRRDSV